MANLTFKFDSLRGSSAALPRIQAPPALSSKLAVALSPEVQVATTKPATAPLRLAANAAAGAAPAGPTSPHAAIGNQLVLTLRDDSWIEVRGIGQNPVTSKLYRAGTVETFDLSNPVQLVIGNASGVDASLRGVPLELRSATKNNVVHLNLK